MHACVHIPFDATTFSPLEERLKVEEVPVDVEDKEQKDVVNKIKELLNTRIKEAADGADAEATTEVTTTAKDEEETTTAAAANLLRDAEPAVTTTTTTGIPPTSHTISNHYKLLRPSRPP